MGNGISRGKRVSLIHTSYPTPDNKSPGYAATVASDTEARLLKGAGLRGGGAEDAITREDPREPTEAEFLLETVMPKNRLQGPNIYDERATPGVIRRRRAS